MPPFVSRAPFALVFYAATAAASAGAVAPRTLLSAAACVQRAFTEKSAGNALCLTRPRPRSANDGAVCLDGSPAAWCDLGRSRLGPNLP